MKFFILFLFVTLISACNNDEYTIIHLSNDSLEVNIKIKEPIEINNNPKDYWTIKGSITINNKRSINTQYGNRFTKLVINEKYFARTYLQTMASVLVDVGEVSLKPHENLAFDVYWNFEEKIDTIKKINLVWHIITI